MQFRYVWQLNGEQVILKDVLFDPNLRKNLLSVPSLSNQKVEVSFMNKHCELLLDGAVIGRASLNTDNVYLLSITAYSGTALAALSKLSMNL